MSLSGATEWEVRDTGSNTNGGGFVAGASGTDYSQQDNANSGANDKSTTDAVAVGTTAITSATANFQTSIVGNIIYLAGGSGGLSAGWYQVLTRTNSTTIGVDRNVAAGTGITMNIGGGLLTLAQAMTNAVIQNTIWMKGSFTTTGSITISQSDSIPFKITGYGSARGDNGRANYTTSTNSVNMFVMANNFQGLIVRNISFSNTAGTRGRCFEAGTGGPANSVKFDNCIFDGFVSAVYGPFSTQYYFEHLAMVNCEVKNSTGAGIRNTGGIWLSGCYVHDNGSDGVLIENTLGNYRGIHAVNCVFDTNTGKGVNSNHRFSSFWNCAFVDNTSDGFYQNTTNLSAIIQNCIFYGNGGFGYNPEGGLACVLRNCAFRNNTSGAYDTTFVKYSQDEVTLTADPFTNKAAGDFTLNNTSGGGAACRAAGFQSTLLG